MKHETRYIDALGLDIQFKIGQNAQDNFAVIESAEPIDLWFHVNDHSSSHVVATIPPNVQLNKKQLMYIAKQGAILCKQHSKYKSQQKVSIIYTTIQNVQPTNIPGTVITQNTKTVVI